MAPFCLAKLTIRSPFQRPSADGRAYDCRARSGSRRARSIEPGSRSSGKVGIGMDFDRMPYYPQRNRVPVVIEPRQQRPGYRGSESVETLERERRHVHERGLLILDHISDGVTTQLGMAMGFGYAGNDS